MQVPSGRGYPASISGHSADGRPDLEWSQSNREIPMKPSEAVVSVILALALLAAAFPSHGQQPAKVYRIGWLGVSAGGYETNPQHCPVKGSPLWQAWLDGLRETGYIPGRNLVIECRYTEGREERAPALAAELVSLKVDLLVASGTVQVRAAKQATSTLPIVMVNVVDPVRRGLVASLAHPGGNVTGLTDTLMEMEGKRLQLLKEAVPKVSRVAVLVHPTGTPEPLFGREREAAARALEVTLQSYGVRAPEEFAGAFTAMTKAGAEALFVEPDPFWTGHEQRIIDLAAQSRLPAVYPNRGFVEAGGLLGYDVNRPGIFRRLGFYVDKILNGAKPADLPVEQPTQFELVINLKTARALGLTIPQSLLSRADEVIQ
jgi:putative ABC transport system substrate-binding protein